MAQEVGAIRRRLEAQPSDRAFHDVRDPGAPQPGKGRLSTNEHGPRRTARAVATDVVRHCLAHIQRERDSVLAVAFPVNDQLTGIPVEVLESQVRDLPRTKAEAGQQQQDGAVAAPTRGVAVTAPDEPAHLLRRDEARKGGQAPVRYRRHRETEIQLCGSSDVREPQEGPQCCDPQLRVSGTRHAGVTQHVPDDARCIQPAESPRPVVEVLEQKRMHQAQVHRDRRFGHAALGAQVRGVLGLDPMRGPWRRSRAGWAEISAQSEELDHLQPGGPDSAGRPIHPSPIAQEFAELPLIERGRVVAHGPPAHLRENLQLLADRVRRIPPRSEALDELIDVLPKGPVA